MTAKTTKQKEQKYYKFLGANLSSTYDKNFFYNAPTFHDGKWIPTDWIEVSNPDKTSNKVCSQGLHLMKVLKPIYAPYSGNCYEAEGQELLVEDNQKARFVRVRLIRPVSFDEIFHEKVDLSSANLRLANLYSANLRSANLRSADLHLADLRSANLRLADLSSADLYSANLNSADLRLADLSSADLYSADLSSADLSSVRNFEFAYMNEHTNLKLAILTDELKQIARSKGVKLI